MKRILFTLLLITFSLTPTTYSQGTAANGKEDPTIDQLLTEFIENELSFLNDEQKPKSISRQPNVDHYLKARSEYIQHYKSLYKGDFMLDSREYQDKQIEKITDDIIVANYQTLEMYTSTSLGETVSGLGGVFDYSIRLEKNVFGEWEIVEAYSNDDFSQALKPESLGEDRKVALSTNKYKTRTSTDSSKYDISNLKENLTKIYNDHYVDVKEDPELKTNNVVTPRAGTNRKLNAKAMRAYQDLWWNAYNPRWGRFEKDCTNYVSQVLHAGGAPLDPNGNYKWYYYSMNSRSPSWSGVNELRNYLIGNTYTGPEGSYYSGYLENLKIGDLIQLRRAGQNYYYHTLIVCSPGKDPIMTAHTANRKQRLSAWSGYAGSVKIKTGYYD